MAVVDSPVDWVNKHIRDYVESDGAKGHEWQPGVYTLLLTTTGRKSGNPRRTALIYQPYGDAHVVVASHGGAPEHPAWYRNLQADPAARVRVGPREFAVTARTATGEERARLWDLMNEVWPDYAEYQTRTDREIPVVVLDPA
ncbi:nitroreductase family deazaflavin-dependent oxidoreductase [Saccharothrix algeriensis]|uniref:Deazaflavin-dependent oxidoreductase (Nitroreductase family) n=1 Tax=Saccharothrix algeriensis TaxID=173560 RepID=A0A8T8I3R1_9PSEU|nr:nitroreductase family deazaflavin-dependent oxidoreductase [Saccharothrix algeriensis]MBM7811636.1 deazaflavin-dependent oxidoreductase (nitroreductase family) [Saccharothrix algeriensis]QTR05422.1 nitroreductase family deazaflavin-dependent oxidoreductase [Saccharothrix algeriensis]